VSEAGDPLSRLSEDRKPESSTHAQFKETEDLQICGGRVTSAVGATNWQESATFNDDQGLGKP